MDEDKNKAKDESFSSTTDDETVTVALHICLPIPSAADLISRISSSTEMTDREEVTVASGFTTTRLNKGQYWIPKHAIYAFGTSYVAVYMTENLFVQGSDDLRQRTELPNLHTPVCNKPTHT
uniref:Uncharacterized protein n=1 Tax=Nelumbo nucifera TaxID=4432 RepID=A0A822XZF1_NELNU|nr:TPA_asm: hypothetical protein HUJ06_026876 [Nelumbo nucifera]